MHSIRGKPLAHQQAAPELKATHRRPRPAPVDPGDFGLVGARLRFGPAAVSAVMYLLQ